ncbi:hypothetical protein PENTCL1PPCAC_27383, partial [Pristionchus entomophagus]
LFQMEADEKWNEYDLRIGSQECSYFDRHGETITELDGEREDYVEGLKKMATNVKISSLTYECQDANDVLLFPYIKNLQTNHNSIAEAEFSDDRLDEWINGKTSVFVWGPISCKAEFLHRKFLDMDILDYFHTWRVESAAWLASICKGLDTHWALIYSGRWE